MCSLIFCSLLKWLFTIQLVSVKFSYWSAHLNSVLFLYCLSNSSNLSISLNFMKVFLLHSKCTAFPTKDDWCWIHFSFQRSNVRERLGHVSAIARLGPVRGGAFFGRGWRGRGRGGFVGSMRGRGGAGFQQNMVPNDMNQYTSPRGAYRGRLVRGRPMRWRGGFRGRFPRQFMPLC